jgi:4-diphosphocytidyl-2-C-methyl-D-erythritol kinase
VTRAQAHAKINLALAVGPRRGDGMHQVATVLQRVTLADELALETAPSLRVDGFDDDTLVRAALTALAAAATVDAGWGVRIEKRIPVAAGLGGGSSDAAAALLLGNATLPDPLSPARLHELARAVGADVPFFLERGPQLGTGDGSELEPVELRQDYACLLLLPRGAEKESTASVYARFDDSDGAVGFEGRLARIRAALATGDLEALPPNDLASSPLADEVRALGAFRADVSGAGPTLYGLFRHHSDAARAADALASRGRTWVVDPAW